MDGYLVVCGLFLGLCIGSKGSVQLGDGGCQRTLAEVTFEFGAGLRLWKGLEMRRGHLS